MPKLIYFVACEKVLVGEEVKLVSLIDLLDALRVPAPPAEPADIQAGMTWHLVSYWSRQPEDQGKVYQQRTRVVMPNGQTSAEAIVDFEMEKRSHRNTVKIFGFPISQPGEYSATLSIRESGQDEWTDIASYPIHVEHIEMPQ